MPNEYIIRVVLKARDELTATLARLRAEMETFQRDLNSKHGDTFAANLGRDLDNLETKIHGVREKVNSWRAEMKSLADDSGLKKMAEQAQEVRDALTQRVTGGLSGEGASKEADRLAAARTRLANSTDDWRRANGQALAAEKKAKEATGESVAVHTQRAAALRAESERLRQVMQDNRRYVNEVQGNVKARQDVFGGGPQTQKTVDLDVGDAERKLAELEVQIERWARKKATAKTDAETRLAKLKLDELALKADEIGHKHPTLRVDADRSLSVVRDGLKDIDNEVQKSGRWTQLMEGWARSNDHAALRTSALASNLRGLIILGVLTFAQQLLSIVTALAGEMVSLASAAVMAGAALGGAFAAGAAQAVPIVGLLAEAFHRVSFVMQAVQQQSLVQQQQFAKAGKSQQQHTTTTNQLANAHDGLVKAQEGVAQAQLRVIETQRALTVARRDAARQIVDLIYAEKDAELAAKGAVLSEADAQQKLRQALTSGDTTAIARDRLDLQQAHLGVAEAATKETRAHQDAANARAKGAGSPADNVTQAKRAVDDAKRSVVDAERAVVQAQRGIQDAALAARNAGSENLASVGKLNYILAKELDDAERGMYKSIMKIQADFKEAFRPITDIIINSFTRAIDRIDKLLKNNEILGGFRRLAHGLADGIDGLVKSFTNKKTINQFSQIMKDAADNIKPFFSIISSLGHAWLNIAIAAAPVLHDIMEAIRGWADGFEKSTSHTSKLRDFFKSAETYLKSLVHFAGAFFNLIGALVGASAPTGKKAFDDMADAMNKWADGLRTHGSEARHFFEQAHKAAKAVWSVIEAIGKAIFHAFDSGQVESLAHFFNNTLIPALSDVIRVMGKITHSFLALAANPVVGPIIRLVTEMLLFQKIITTISHLGFAGKVALMGRAATDSSPAVAGLAGNFRKVAHAAIDAFGVGGAVPRALGFLKLIPAEAAAASTGMEALSIAATGPAAPFIALGAIIAGLITHFHDWGKVLDPIKKAFSDIWSAVKGPIHDLGKAFDSIGIHIKLTGKGLDAIKPIVDILAKTIGFLARTMITFFGGPIVTAVKFFSETIKGVANIFRGVFDVIDGIIHGDGSKILKGFKEIGNGILQGLLAPLKAIWAGIKFIFNGIVNAVKDLLGISSPSKVFLEIGHAIVDGLLAPLKLIVHLVKSIFNAMKNAITSVIHAVLKFIGNRWDDIKHLIAAPFRWAVKFFGGLGSDLVGAVKGAFSGVFDFFSSLPGKIVGFIKSLPGKIKDVFSGLGDALIHGFVGGAIADVGNFAKNLAQGIAKLIDRAIPNSIHMPDPLPNIDLPNNPLKDLGMYRAGGRVPGGMVARDTVPAMLAPGEGVVTSHGERMIDRVGGPGFFSGVLRSQLPHGYLAGGRVGFAAGGRAGVPRGVDSGKAQVGLTGDAMDAIINIISHGGAKMQAVWGDAWDTMLGTTSRRSDQITKRTDKLHDDSIGSLKDMARQGRVQGDKFFNFIADSFQNADDAAFSGISYIAQLANQALKEFGAKPISVNVTRPKALHKATGGMIGHRGEATRDTVPAMLGRGEAVLNRHQQPHVERALAFARAAGISQYGSLDEVFANEQRPHYLATGGRLTGPFGSGAAFGPVAAFAKNKFGLTMTAGRTNHGYNTSSGNVSDHSWGGAGDFSNGVLTPQEDAFNAFWKRKLPQLVKQLIWRGRDQLQGFPIEDHENHVHLALNRGIAFDAPRMARILSRASHGLSVAELVRGLGTSGAIEAQHVDAPKVTGRGPLKALTSQMLSKAVRAANDHIDNQAMKMGGSAAVGAELDLHYDGPLNKVFPRFLQGSPGRHVRLTPGQVAGLAEKAGLPGTTFAQIAHGESDYYPGIQQRDPGDGNVGYGLWQQTPHAWGAGSSAFKFMQRLGGIPAMFNPWKNALMAKYLYDAAGHTIRPWFGTRYVHTVGAGTHARGGYADGQPMPIIAHAGEMVLNKHQQMLLGGPGYLSRVLGFGGEAKSHFSDGGIVGAAYKTTPPPRVTGGHEQRHTDGGWVALAFLREMDAIEERIKKLRQGGTTKAEKKIIERLNKYHDKLDEQSDRIAAASINDGLKTVERQIARLRRGSEDKAQNAAIKRLNALRDRLLTLAFDIPAILPRSFEGLRDVTKRIVVGLSHLLSDGKKGVKRFSDALVALTGDGGLLDQMTTAIERHATNIATHIRRSTYAIRSYGVKRIRDDASVQRATLASLVTAHDELLGEKGIIQSSLKRTAREMRKYLRDGGKKGDKAYQDLVANQRNLQQRADDINGKLADNVEARFQAQQAIIDAVVSEANAKAARRTARLDLRSNIATALGRVGDIAQIAQQRVGVINDQMTDLGKALKIAKKNHDTDKVHEIQDQIAELQNQITMIAIDQFNATTEQINAAASRRSSHLDLYGRMADALGKVGLAGAVTVPGLGGESLSRSSVFAARNTNMVTQRTALEQQRQIAIFTGMQQQEKDLTDQIAELDVTIAENTKAYFQARVDDTNARAAFRTGTDDLKNQIIDLQGEISGSTDTASKLANLMDKQSALVAQGNDLQSLYNEAVAKDDQAAVQDLTTQLLQNQIAQLENTKAIKELNGTVDQSFSTTAWQWFRKAVFDGSGGLLPQYKIPSLDVGGTITKDGMIYGHAGEIITPATVVRGEYGGGGPSMEAKIYVEEKVQKADPTAISEDLMFKWKTRR